MTIEMQHKTNQYEKPSMVPTYIIQKSVKKQTHNAKGLLLKKIKIAISKEFISRLVTPATINTAQLRWPSGKSVRLRSCSLGFDSK